MMNYERIHWRARQSDDVLRSDWLVESETFISGGKIGFQAMPLLNGFPADLEFRWRNPPAFPAEFRSVDVPLLNDELQTCSLGALGSLTPYCALIGLRRAKAFISHGKIGLQAMLLAAWFSGGF